MQTTPANGARRTGATWVAATGAFMLLAAATVFVASRWDDIPEAAKLAALVGITGACALIGDRLRRTLPATGNALFHLGALLIPIDIAALGIRTSMTWGELLLIDSVVSAVLLAICAQRARSVVLAAAASGGVLAAAGGVAALTDVPAPFVLAVAAIAACFAPHLQRHAFAWASAAAVAPLTLLALDGAVTGHGVARELGLLTVPWGWSVATAALTSIVVIRGARQRGEAALGLVALAGCAAHGIAAWNATDTPHVLDVLAAPSLFLVAELMVLAVRRDAFWAKPAHVAGQVLEAVATWPTLVAVPAAIIVAANGERFGDTAVAAGIGALAWIVADRRRNGWWAGLPAACALALFAIAAATASPTLLGASAALLGLAAALTVERTRMIPLAYGLAGFATLAAFEDHATALWVALASVAVFAVAIWRAHGAPAERFTGLFLAVVALAIGESATGPEIALSTALLVWIGACWVLAVVGDRVDRNAGDVLRATAFGVLPFPVELTPVEALGVALLLTGLAAGDAFRLRRVELAIAAVLPAIAAEIALAALAELTIAEGGLVMCVSASVWLGLAAVERDPWRTPLAVGAGASALVGLLGAGLTAATFGPALLVVGALGIALGLVYEQRVVSHLGGAIATIGIWITLASQQVFVSEAYLAPVALQLLIAGMTMRASSEQRPSSWVAFGPAITLLAASAIAERIAGGSSWHSLLAGGVGVVAVAYGGWRRALAPLLLGTATLIAVVIRETFDSAAGVPTWAWLATGGSALIAAAVAMERNDVSPIEAGRRVVDVIGSQFD